MLPNRNSVIIIFVFAIAFFAACRNGEKLDAHHKELWTCSMHPEIIRDEPGSCPICGMDLVKKGENAPALTGIQLDDLLQPTDRFVVSSIPVTTINKSSEPVEVAAFGRIAYDTRLISTIAAKISGRIEKLYVRYRYQHVHEGEKIMDIYSPELLTEQQNLLFIIKNDPGNHSLLEAAKQRLLLSGMTETQLRQIILSQKPALTITVYSNASGHIHEAGAMEMALNNDKGKMDISRITEELPIKEGMYVQKGQTVFQLFNTDRSWILLNIFPENQALIKVGNAVRVTPETAPGKNFRATISFIEPFYQENSKTLTARAYFDNSKLMIPIGSQVRATIFGNNKEAEWLPKDAVLSLGMDKIVFLKTMGGFKAHKIEMGIMNKDRIQILSGLSPDDSVAVNAQFLTDSESFIKIKD
jgi:membrane fusion protein, copper/silver efflux system